MITRLNSIYTHLVESVNTSFIRYNYSSINWDNRLIMIKGPKGVGKTTMLLQHIKTTFPDKSKALYASADNSFFSTHTIVELAEYLASHGITHLFLDEVHRYKGWDKEIKEIYDSYTKLNVVITGSSMLRLEESEADLGRRCRQYTMQGLSFREYLKLEGVADWEPVTLEELLDRHTEIAAKLTNELPVLAHFENYLKLGYFPFYKEDKDGFAQRLETTINNIIQTEIPAVEQSIEYESVYKIKQLLGVLSEQNPYTLNIKHLCSLLSCSREVLYKLLNLMNRAQLIRRLYVADKGLKIMEKPEKILFDNTNIMMTLSDNADKGTIRETFFSNILSCNHTLCMPERGDLLVDGKYLFEVGGKKKSFKQIADIPDSYVVSDGIDVGFGNKIPLWLFGMLY